MKLEDGVQSGVSGVRIRFVRLFGNFDSSHPNVSLNSRNSENLPLRQWYCLVAVSKTVSFGNVPPSGIRIKNGMENIKELIKICELTFHYQNFHGARKQ